MDNPQSPPSAAAPQRYLGGGANQLGARAYNDRLILSLIRRAGPLPKAEMARMTGLSPQTLTLIVKRLEQDGLLLPEKRTRGKAGQPSVPFRLNPDAVFAFGLKIGRRSMELTLCDFAGAVRERVEQFYDFPEPSLAMRFFEAETDRIRSALPEGSHAKIIGTGIAMPFEIWAWEDELGGPKGALEAWKDYPIKERAQDILRGGEVYLCNDATAACAAELFSAGAQAPSDFFYVYIGWFVGGGVVLNGTLVQGRTENAGAIGSLPIPAKGGHEMLLDQASLMALEGKLRIADEALDMRALFQSDKAVIAAWIEGAASAIAYAALSVSSVLDFQAMRIDGAMPAEIRDRLVEKVAACHAQLDKRGLSPMRIEPGRVGRDARSIGAAILPIHAGFSRDSGVLLKSVE